MGSRRKPPRNQDFAARVVAPGAGLRVVWSAYALHSLSEDWS